MHFSRGPDIGAGPPSRSRDQPRNTFPVEISAGNHPQMPAGWAEDRFMPTVTDHHTNCGLRLSVNCLLPCLSLRSCGYVVPQWYRYYQVPVQVLHVTVTVHYMYNRYYLLAACLRNRLSLFPSNTSSWTTEIPAIRRLKSCQGGTEGSTGSHQIRSI